MIPNLTFGSFVIPTYFLIISLSICLSIYWAYQRSLKNSDYSIQMTLDVSLMIFIFGGIGGRLFHVFYESPQYYLQSPLKILALWEGGFVFYGGMLLSALAVYLYLNKKKESFWKWADFLAAPLALCYALGRLGCFAAGCCYGKACALPWGVHFPFDPGIARHPTQLYAVAYELLAVLFILKTEKRQSRFFQHTGQIFLFWLMLHSVGRIFMERFREDYRGIFIWGLSVSTWISLLILLTALGYFVRNLFQRPVGKII